MDGPTKTQGLHIADGAVWKSWSNLKQLNRKSMTSKPWACCIVCSKCLAQCSIEWAQFSGRGATTPKHRTKYTIQMTSKVLGGLGLESNGISVACATGDEQGLQMLCVEAFEMLTICSYSTFVVAGQRSQLQKGSSAVSSSSTLSTRAKLAPSSSSTSSRSSQTLSS